ncbi:lipoate-protein ligase A [Marinitoga hydrogenitolerans DSM 16785]|uniref:Lipoate-protein ligase A n=1 Tax=Marinitoga hydrogenitolerans (strain DSM 16785 / JCM 12826 / AT1271) TaxID=1122195 RepID=A0A1M4WR65_MARH1|nr:lipoate--protein ligase family protein [Marinitoga hydrogenitolerans]SHE83708.1 lipoate-protein ligase A [Marinitoga hydrogenitolerans DSM 16785]
MKLYIIESKNTNVYYNLAIEEYLINNTNNNIFIFFWKSKNSLVIGKHQNPWKEINFNFELVKNGEIKIARRISGGGTVFHDLGNLNYSFVSPKNYLNSQEIFEIIIKTLKNMDIDVEKNYKNDLIYKDYKFSGSAFSIKKDKFLHHGTLLINSNLELINETLGKNEKIKTKATESKPSKVINLKEINYCINEEMIKNNIIRETSKYLKLSGIKIATKYFRDESLMEKHKSWEWIYGNTPKFIFKFEDNEFNVENGYITYINSKKLKNPMKFDLMNFENLNYQKV